MRIIHGKGYTDKDRAEFAGLVYRNIITAVQTLAEAMERLKISYVKDSNRVSSFSKTRVNVLSTVTNLCLCLTYVRTNECALS